MNARIGVDIGGTKIAVALVSDAGEVLGEVLRSSTPRGGELILDSVADAVRRVTGQAQPNVAVGVAAAGVIDQHGSVRSAATTMSGWEGVSIRDGLGSRLGCAVRVMNDVHAVAVAEASLGAGRGFRRVLAVAVGTGIGGGFVIDGRLDSGATGVAASVGHVVVPSAAGEPCPCGAFSHAEGLARGPALEEYYAGVTGGNVVSLREVAERSRNGDRKAVETVTYGGRVLGEALSSAANVLDPDVIVLGGGVAEIGAPYFAAALESFQSGAMPLVRSVPIVPAALGVSAPIVGSALLCI